jgi:hypothetical protein
MKRSRLLLLLAIIGVLVTLGIITTARRLHSPNLIATATEARLQLRVAADSCQQALAERQAALHAFRAGLDSMRGRVTELESLDPRGVPVDSYPVYMQAYEQYNETAGTWDGRVTELQDELARCREIVQAHNEATDTLRRLLDQRQR